ncbi:hypothetical protein NMY22_g18068 [Coprinellus aureogranulatus]|nr:hypothetical protein NMY22_g18068 [Coprinellus aureogranulatus]
MGISTTRVTCISTQDGVRLWVDLVKPTNLSSIHLYLYVKLHEPTHVDSFEPPSLDSLNVRLHASPGSTAWPLTFTTSSSYVTSHASDPVSGSNTFVRSSFKPFFAFRSGRLAILQYVPRLHLPLLDSSDHGQPAHLPSFESHKNTLFHLGFAFTYDSVKNSSPQSLEATLIFRSSPLPDILSTRLNPIPISFPKLCEGIPVMTFPALRTRSSERRTTDSAYSSFPNFGALLQHLVAARGCGSRWWRSEGRDVDVIVPPAVHIRQHFRQASAFEFTRYTLTRWVDSHLPPTPPHSPKVQNALHMHSVTNPHNFGRVFSSPAPGFVMGVGSVGKSLGAYDEGDTFLSTDAGISWKMVAKGAHKYEFGDQGSILVLVDDEQLTSEVKFSLDLGKTWDTYDFGVTLRARGLVTLPDSTSQKFLLLGQVPRDTKKNQPTKVVIVYLDFAATRKKKCTDSDFEKWYARPPGSRSCLMGHKQWYKRRKPDADCYVGEKFNDPEEHDENCECTKEDYECDYNFIRHGDKCDPKQTYMGSSGFRKIPGNTCVGGVKLDDKVSKPCSKAKPAEGEIVHQQFSFSSPVVQHAYFKDSPTILVRLADHTIWQSSNEGYTWNQIRPEMKFLAFYHHKYSNERAYLITDHEKVFYTTDSGRTWNNFNAPTAPNTFGAQVLRFTPADTDYILWVGNRNCVGTGQYCHAEAQLSRDNGRKWQVVEKYVRNCAFAKDRELDTDPTEIICESFTNKKGRQEQEEAV